MCGKKYLIAVNCKIRKFLAKHMHPMHPREQEKSTFTISREMLSRTDSDLQPPPFVRAIIDLARHNKAVYHTSHLARA
jgi:hypothetical protein